MNKLPFDIIKIIYEFCNSFELQYVTKKFNVILNGYKMSINNFDRLLSFMNFKDFPVILSFRNINNTNIPLFKLIKTKELYLYYTILDGNVTNICNIIENTKLEKIYLNLSKCMEISIICILSSLLKSSIVNISLDMYNLLITDSILTQLKYLLQKDSIVSLTLTLYKSIISSSLDTLTSKINKVTIDLSKCRVRGQFISLKNFQQVKYLYINLFMCSINTEEFNKIMKDCDLSLVKKIKLDVGNNSEITSLKMLPLMTSDEITIGIHGLDIQMEDFKYIEQNIKHRNLERFTLYCGFIKNLKNNSFDFLKNINPFIRQICIDARYCGISKNEFKYLDSLYNLSELNLYTNK